MAKTMLTHELIFWYRKKCKNLSYQRLEESMSQPWDAYFDRFEANVEIYHESDNDTDKYENKNR